MSDIVNQVKQKIKSRHGKMQSVGDGRSLFFIETINAFVYFRYGKVMRKSKPYAFFGLRKQDIDLARGSDFYICFITDEPGAIFILPFSDFEACYDYAGVTSDGQYKTTLYFKEDDVELYIPKSARFSVESYRGLELILHQQGTLPDTPLLDHSGAQSLVGAIGAFKGHKIWFPKNDLDKIDRQVIDFSKLCGTLPSFGMTIDAIFQEIDVIWLSNNKPVAMFEVEHSTPIYSGLLRINDILIASATAIDAKIVAEQSRRDLFQRQIRRPTFTAHKLEDKVSFISYDNVWRWSQTLRENNEQ